MKWYNVFVGLLLPSQEQSMLFDQVRGVVTSTIASYYGYYGSSPLCCSISRMSMVVIMLGWGEGMVQEPLKVDLVISFPEHGFHLRFEPRSQVHHHLFPFGGDAAVLQTFSN